MTQTTQIFVPRGHAGRTVITHPGFPRSRPIKRKYRTMVRIVSRPTGRSAWAVE